MKHSRPPIGTLHPLPDADDEEHPMATPPDEPMFPAVADALTEQRFPAVVEQRPETTLGRPLLWAAAWGGLGALLAATTALIALFLFVMAFLSLVAATSETTTIGDVWEGSISGLLTLPFSPEVVGFALRVCTVSAVLAMGSLLVLRLSATVRRWTPRMQGFAAAAATYAFLSAIGSVLGTIAQAVIATW
jgi:hypothetical protein